MRVASLARYARTVRYLTPGQIVWRGIHEARFRAYRAWPAWFAARWRADARARIALGALAPPPGELLARERAVASRWRRGEVEHLGESGPASDWTGQGRSRLWRYERHYHTELLALAALAASDPDAGWERDARVLLKQWTAACPPPAGDAWEPYPVARRILSWSLAAVLVPRLGAELAPQLALHLHFLRAHLERHLLGNHLLCDAAALVTGAAVLDAAGAEAAGRLGERILRGELASQVLADGGYAERTAHYHAIVLRDVLIAAVLAARRGRPLPEPILAKLRAMTRWLALVCRGDEAPWLNDAAPGAMPAVSEVLALAAAAGIAPEAGTGWLARSLGFGPIGSPKPVRPTELELPDTGWTIVRAAGGHELLFEHGAIGPDHQPGHGHSDALSYELFWSGQSIVADSGVTTYEPGAVRAFERSARAHATVTVGGEGPDELWGAFRVGSRARVWNRPMACQGQARLLRGELRAPAGWTHQRGLIYWPGHVLVVLDRLENARGEVISRVPLARGVVAKNGALDAGEVVLRFEVLRGVELAPVAGAEAPRDGWIGEGFGRALPRTCLRIAADREGSLAYAVLAENVRVSLDMKQCGLRGRGGRVDIPLGSDGLPR
jgi:hypothetical protein